MTNEASSTSSALVDRVANWLIGQALGDSDLETIVRGCCERLSGAGVPLYRAHFSFSVLHPLYRAMGFTWRRGAGLEIEGYRHLGGDEPDRFIKSPYYHMLQHDLDHIRRRLEENTKAEFPIFDDLRAEGVTDYLAYAVPFAEGRHFGMMGSWSTDRAGGFSDGELHCLLRIQDRLAVACKMAVRAGLADNIVTTYLGKSAGKNVLNGQIKRGDGETIRAAIVACDLRDSTEMAEIEGRQAYIDSLNAFFDATGSAVAEAGGEILAFVGDGFLAIFPCSGEQSKSTMSCHGALGAAHDAVDRMAELNAAREQRGQKPLQFGMGLHMGDVMFGNVGMADRLSFSVFGAAVNEAVRLEKLCKVHGSPIIASKKFRDFSDGLWDDLGSVKLTGVERPMEIFRPMATVTKAKRRTDAHRQLNLGGMTDAENVVLLHKDRRQ